MISPRIWRSFPLQRARLRLAYRKDALSVPIWFRVRGWERQEEQECSSFPARPPVEKSKPSEAESHLPPQGLDGVLQKCGAT